jgi:hypothetical protein
MANVRGNGAQLSRALRDLADAWVGTSESWRDQARRDFEEHHLGGIELRARQAARAITTIEDMLRQAEQECS